MTPKISLNRILFTLISVIGIAATTLSVAQTWFSVPVAPPEGCDSFESIVQAVPRCEVLFKAAMATGVIILIASWLWKKEWTSISAGVAALLFLIPLAFPYFLIVRSPHLSAEAAWLQMQHDNLTWLGGDIYLNAEFGSKAWRTKTHVVDAPKHLAVVNLPTGTFWELGLHRTEDLMQWIGYSNTYCQFVRRGWSMAIMGSFLLFISTLQSKGRLVYHRAAMALTLFSAFASTLVATGIYLPLIASGHIQNASELSSHEQFLQAKQQLDLAATLLPVLEQDTYFISQRGKLDQRLGIHSQCAKLEIARGLERNGFYDRAFEMFRILADSEKPEIRREANRAILRFAIQDFNSGRIELSRERMESVLEHSPCDLKLIYILQLQAIRESRTGRVDELRDWMYAATAHFNFSTTKILRAASQQHSATAVGFTDDPDAIWSSMRKAKRP